MKPCNRIFSWLETCLLNYSLLCVEFFIRVCSHPAFTFPCFLSLYWLQQSAAFKILRTRLKTVPPCSFSGEQIRRTASGTSYSQLLHHIPSGSQVMEDGDSGQDSMGNLHNGINFTARLQQFEQMQQQHRMHVKLQSQTHHNNPPSSKVREAYMIVWFVLFSSFSCRSNLP